jgi:hypothetical protein
MDIIKIEKDKEKAKLSSLINYDASLFHFI